MTRWIETTEGEIFRCGNTFALINEAVLQNDLDFLVVYPYAEAPNKRVYFISATVGKIRQFWEEDD